MAGSLETFVYTTDSGTKYLVRLDESNATEAGFPQATNADLTIPALPNRVKMRYVNCKSESGITRRIFIPTVSSPFWQGTNRTLNLIVVTGLNGSAVPFTTSSRTGEKERYLTTSDTGQTDAAGEGLSPAGASAGT